MTITFTCGNCQSTVSTPDTMAGKKGKCPTCGNIVKIPQPDPTQSIPLAAQGQPSVTPLTKPAATTKPAAKPPAKPAAPAPLPPSQPFGLSDLPSNNPLDDLASFSSAVSLGSSLPPAAPNPYGTRPTPSPSPYGNSPYGAAPSMGAHGNYQGGNRSSAPAWPILVPGYIQLAVNIIALLGITYKLVEMTFILRSLDPNKLPPGDYVMESSFFLLALIGLFSFTVIGLGLFGASCMVRRVNYGMAVTGAVFSMFSFCCAIGRSGIFMAPIGIWSLIVLCIPSYKRQFQS